MTLLLGIDDAGRGPVLGPMILAGVIINEKDERILRDWKTKDSKLLAPKQRGEIKEKIIKKFKYHTEKSTPKEIDDSDNLNYLEAQKTAKIINEITYNVTEKVKVIVDCPSTTIESWTKDVQELIKNPEIIKLSCEHKADANHPIVSAASIVAKETREDEMYKLRLKLKKDFGSGYPADPKTKEFIKENFNNPKYKQIIRFSWSTVKKLIKTANQKTLF